MSLDSVELLVSFENYFGISIPDKEAEKIHKVREMTDSVCNHLGITSSHTRLRNDTFAILKKAMHQTNVATGNVNLNDLVKDFIKYDPKTWQLLEMETGLIIPTFPRVQKDTWMDRIIPGISWKSQADYDTLNFCDLCDVICAANYKTLLDAKNLSSSYEVYIAVMAITEDKTGVDFYDIKPDKSFTNDFGID